MDKIPKMIPVEGHKNLYRDESTGAILNHDTFGYSQYLSLRKKKQKEREEIEQLKTDIDEIKSLLKEFINESRKNSD
jgi:hypothetical protein